jgi:RimJ/RimL family protein N-acetyltransferase
MEKEFIYKMKMILCYRQELLNNGNSPDGIMEFYESLQAHGVEIRILPKRQGEQDLLKQIRQGDAGKNREDKRNTVEEIAREEVASEKIAKEEILVIASTDETIREASAAGMAVFAWKNPEFPGESLMASPVLVESFEELDYEFAERIWRRYHKLPWTILITKRCYVRELTFGDIDDLFVLYQQEGMTDYMEPLYEREEELEYQKAYIENMYGFYGYGMWLVFDQEKDVLIGRAGIENRDLNGTYEMELGYAITPAYQRMGYATEVCIAILAYAKEHLECREIHCMIQKQNLPSIALAKKLGFGYLEMIEMQEQTYEHYTLSLT